MYNILEDFLIQIDHFIPATFSDNKLKKKKKKKKKIEKRKKKENLSHSGVWRLQLYGWNENSAASVDWNYFKSLSSK